MSGKRPQRNNVSERRRVLIFGEGKTEAFYFDRLGGDDSVRRRFVVTPKEGTGGDAQITVPYSPSRRLRF